MADARYTVTPSVAGDVLILAVDGEIDASTSRAAGATLIAAIPELPPPDTVVVDLSDVGFFAAAGVHLLATVIRLCGERHVAVRLVADTGTITRRVVRIAGFDKVAPVFATLEDALSAK